MHMNNPKTVDWSVTTYQQIKCTNYQVCKYTVNIAHEIMNNKYM